MTTASESGMADPVIKALNKKCLIFYEKDKTTASAIIFSEHT